MKINKLIIQMIIVGIISWFSYLYIRKYLNPENKNNINKYRDEAYYTGVASGVSFGLVTICKNVIDHYI